MCTLVIKGYLYTFRKFIRQISRSISGIKLNLTLGFMPYNIKDNILRGSSLNIISSINIFGLTCLSNNGGLSLTSVISTVKEQTPSRLGSPWSVAFTVTDTNLPSSPSRSNTLLVETSPVSSSTVNFVPFWLGCWTMEYLTWPLTPLSSSVACT